MKNDRRESDKLGFWSIVLLAINSIIGSGIFLTPGSVVSRVGSKALLVYLIAASFAAILAITFAAAAKYAQLMLIVRQLLAKMLVFIWGYYVTFPQV